MLNIIKTIVLALISAAFAIVIEQAIAIFVNIFWHQEIIFESYEHFTWFLALAVIIEETFKYWTIYFVIRKNFGLEKMKLVFSSLLLGTVWGISEIGLVFFFNQKYLYALQSGDPEVIFSSISVIALHILTAFLMGVFISTNIFPGRLKHLKILFFPILMHLLFNFLIIQKGDFTNFLLFISLGIAFFVGVSVLAFNFKKLA